MGVSPRRRGTGGEDWRRACPATTRAPAHCCLFPDIGSRGFEASTLPAVSCAAPPGSRAFPPLSLRPPLGVRVLDARCLLGVRCRSVAFRLDACRLVLA